MRSEAETAAATLGPGLPARVGRGRKPEKAGGTCVGRGRKTKKAPREGAFVHSSIINDTARSHGA